uniref:SURF1-like protein n=1 Tax=Heterorhabditis bacteriophora TaxID=37862 RepID=A0A1I7XBM1_HETBA
MAASPLTYKIMSCSSKDKDLIRQHSNSEKSLQKGNEVCWFSQRCLFNICISRHYCMDKSLQLFSGYPFPQSLVIQLTKLSSVRRIDIFAHPNYLPSSMTIAFGIPNNEIGKTSKQPSVMYSIIENFTFIDDDIISDTKTVLADNSALFIRSPDPMAKSSKFLPSKQIAVLPVGVYHVHSAWFRIFFRKYWAPNWNSSYYYQRRNGVHRHIQRDDVIGLIQPFIIRQDSKFV